MLMVFIGISFLYKYVSQALTLLCHIQLCSGIPVILTCDLVHDASQQAVVAAQPKGLHSMQWEQKYAGKPETGSNITDKNVFSLVITGIKYEWII